MKALQRIATFLLCFLSAAAGLSQERTVRIGANASSFFPIGGMSVRFRPAIGGSIQITSRRGAPQWGGTVEYFKFDRENTDKLFVTRAVTDSVAGTQQTYRIPLPKLSMSLEIVGAALHGSYEIWSSELLETRFGFGFGIYHWKGTRASYYDTLRVQGSRGPLIADILKVPENTQEDWSGGFNIGADVYLRLLDPVSVNVGGHYKAVIGELWPALALDLENVSTMQMLELRAGLSVDL